ncbi:MAG TPA: glycosyltransferase family 4 protein [Polyangia bacterium]|nr:glycosyltransferase family 4 protein [Polyangia bacterium]
MREATRVQGSAVPGRPISVLVLAPYPYDRAPGQRYRIEQWMPRLEALGVRCELQTFEDDALYDLMEKSGRWPHKAARLLARAMRHFSVIPRVARHDAVFLFREALIFGPALIESVVARRKPLVFDFDDAIWQARPNRLNPLAPLLKFQGKTRSIARQARAVIAGNDYLADWARGFNSSVFVVPSTIEMEGSYARAKQHGQRGPLVIGWSGSFSTLQYLDQLRPILIELGKRRPFRLRVICNGPRPDWPGIDLDWLPWSSADEVRDLLAIDIGLMPQPDDQWTRGKCGMKALQYMALGIPPVVSNNGVLPRIVEDGVSGFLAAEPAQWLERLDTLAADPSLRERMGSAARRTVIDRFSAAAQAPRVAEILRGAAGLAAHG